MEQKIGMKEMYDVDIRLNSPQEIGGRKYDKNETILTFDKIEISQLNENKTHTVATGGFNNNILIDWEIDKEITFSVTHGILSKNSMALLSNSKLRKMDNLSVPYKETVPVIEDNNCWFVLLKYSPNYDKNIYGIQGNPENEQLPMGRKDWIPLKKISQPKDRFIFCYDMDTKKRILNFDIEGNKIIFKAEHKRVLVDYTFTYNEELIQLDIGNRLTNNFLNLTGKITTKDYVSGEPATAFITIPKIKVISSLIIKLGNGYDCAAVGDFYFIGYPEDSKMSNDQKVCSIYFLPTELTGDYV